MHIQTNMAYESFPSGVENIQYKDIEDSCQHEAAVAKGCECIITYNVKDYPHSLLPVLSPSDLCRNDGR